MQIVYICYPSENLNKIKGNPAFTPKSWSQAKKHHGRYLVAQLYEHIEMYL